MLRLRKLWQKQDLRRESEGNDGGRVALGLLARLGYISLPVKMGRHTFPLFTTFNKVIFRI